MTASDQNDTETQIIRYGDENKPTQTIRVPARRRVTGCPTRSGTVTLVILVLIILSGIFYIGQL